MACRTDKVDVIELFLTSGADIEARTAKNATPLHIATTKGVVNSVKLLLKSGASIQAKDGAGYSSLHIASQLSNKEVFDVLYEAMKDDPSSLKNLQLQSPLHLAIAGCKKN